MDVASADNLAQSFLSQLGRSKGVVSVPNCGNGQLARAFLAASGMKVHAMDASQANVDATRQLIEPTGKIGSTCIIEKGNLSVMPYVNRFVDCIAITNVTDADLARIPYAEIQRVLAPDGLAFIGRATAEGAGITSAALQNWINAASKTRSTAVVSTTGGTWAVITGLELSGVDVWPRHNYDANGTNYSKDSVAAFPWMPQAKLKPYIQVVTLIAGSGGTTVTSGGRLYEVAKDVGTAGYQSESPIVLLRAYSIYNGELLWSRNVANDGLGTLSGDPIRAYGRDVYLMRSSGGILQLNGITGAEIGTVASVPSAPQSPLARPGNGVSGCQPYHASIYYTFNGTGQIGWDFHINAARGAHYYKPPCGVVGTIISNGMMTHMRSTCTCGSSRYWGSSIDGPAGSFQFDRDAAADGSDRLEKGTAFGAVSAQVIPDALDWPTHRANNSRSGSTSVSVSTSASSVRLMWNRQPQFGYVTQVTTLGRDFRPEQEPTPPVTAGGYTFIGGTDGFVRCFDNASGSPVWSYLTGGRIYATPTVWNGCVYVGSGDGYAYCIEAHSGRLVWRFRGAPVDMRMNLYGYLASVWPILTGVLVDAGGNAYFAAGMQSEFGTHVYCVNAVTGALKWQNNKTATVLNAQERLGVTPSGYMTLAKNKLIMASSVPAVASFDLTTGALDPTLAQWFSFMAQSCGYCENLAKSGYPVWSVNKGREVGILNNTYFVSGGCYIFRDNTYRDRAGYYQQEIGFQALDGNGTPTYPLSRINQATSVTPAWDSQDFFHIMAGTRRLEGYQISSLSTALNARMALPATEYTWGTNYGTAADYGNGTFDLNSTLSWQPTPLFSNKTLYFNAVVLASNALVATYAKADPGVPETVAWYVGALSRTTGATLWEIALPDVGSGLKGQPLAQGLAIDRVGNVIVTLYNGNVLCYGTGAAVSVAQRDQGVPEASVTPVANTPVVSAWMAAEALAPAALPSRPADRLPGTSSQSQASTDAAGSVVGLVGTMVAVTPPYEALKDSSDMADVNGVLMHTVSPRERGPNAAYKARSMRWEPGRACLTVAAVSASSSARGCGPGATIDRDLTSRWSPAGNGSQSVTYDLGTAQEVSAVSVVWYATKTSRAALAIETSTDGQHFGTVDEGALNGRGTNTALRSFLPGVARFVRVTLDAPVSVYEVGIHGPESDTRSAASK
jgi:outer membrane protein assembly factor BamB